MGLDRCPNINLLAMAHTPEGTIITGERVAILAYIRCKGWECDFCLPLNVQMWRAFLRKRLSQLSRSWWMMTLTAHSKAREHSASYHNLQKGIDVLLKRMRRLFGDLDYVRVFEMHIKNKTLHAHFIINGITPWVAVGASVKHKPMFIAVTEKKSRAGYWSAKTWLKDAAAQCKIGYIADIKPIPSISAVDYVMSYMTKEMQAFEIPYVRRIQTTRRIGSPKIETDHYWIVGKAFTNTQFEENELLLDTKTGEVLEPDLWEDDYIYPPDEAWDKRRGKEK